MRRLCKFLMLSFVALVVAFSASAVDSAKKVEFKKISEQLGTIESALQSEEATAEDVETYTSLMYELTGELYETKRDNEREAKVIQKQLDALGEEPADGTSEFKEITEKRQELKKELSVYNNRMAEAEVLQVKIDNLNLLLLNYNNQRILESLSERQPILLLPTNFVATLKVVAVFFLHITISPLNWFYSLTVDQKDLITIYAVPMGVILALCVWLILLFRRYLLKKVKIKDKKKPIMFFKKVLIATGYALAHNLSSLLLFLLMYAFFAAPVFDGSFLGRICQVFAKFALSVILFKMVTRTLLLPEREEIKFLSMSVAKSKAIYKALNLNFVLVALAEGLKILAEEISNDVLLLNFFTIVCAVFKALAIITVTAQILKKERGSVSLLPSVRYNVLTTLLCCFVVGVALFGYPALASYIFDRYILTWLVIALFFVVHKGLLKLTRRLLLMEFWGNTFEVRRKLLSRVNFGLSLSLTPILVLTALFAVLHIWGFSSDFLLHIGRKILFGFKIGGMTISIMALVMGVVTFFVVLGCTKAIRTHLIQNVFSKLEMEEGIKHSLSAFIGFLGFILAILLAIVAMGADLTSLTVIAGALSVGIGFGLQNIVSNFISGIIILFERPFKVGDWVILSGEEGQIKQINIRSTELETFQKTSVIIPNATLLSSSLVNLTHGNNQTRQSVKVSVAYGSDVEKVREILIACAKANPKVLKKPAPYVIFQNFGDSSLDFELRCYSDDIWNGWSIPSELRYEIVKRFEAENIEIPFPQIVVHKGAGEDK